MKRVSGAIIRRAAAGILAVAERERPLDDFLDECPGELRRSVGHLLFSYFRHKRFIDALLAARLEKPPRPPVYSLLRAAAAQIFFQSMTYSDVRRESALNPAKSGALAFAATWHGFPVGQSEEYYNKTLHKYVQQGKLHFGDKEKWHCSDMFFRVLRELQFIKSRPEWDGKNLISHGGSLGGIQSTFASAIDKDVSLSVIGVPAFCECNAFEAGRMPYGDFRTKRDPATLDFGFHFDAINFGRRITCEVYVCTGFCDETCRPSNVLALYNAIPATTKKALTTDPRTGHFGTTKNVKGNARVDEILRNTVVSELPK